MRSCLAHRYLMSSELRSRTASVDASYFVHAESPCLIQRPSVIEGKQYRNFIGFRHISPSPIRFLAHARSSQSLVHQDFTRPIISLIQARKYVLRSGSSFVSACSCSCSPSLLRSKNSFPNPHSHRSSLCFSHSLPTCQC